MQKTRIKGTLEWRREYKPELIQPGDVGVEAETGKIILSGFDVDARPIIYMRPGRENTERSPRQIRHLIYHLERAIDFMPPGQEQVAIVVDYKSATSQSNPSISVARQVLNILQNHYVERLGRGLVVNMPWWINAFFSGITPFLDPITRDKIRFNPDLIELIPEAQLDSEFGGKYNLEYDYNHYWKTLTDFCFIAEDGTRVKTDGTPFFPPLGSGIKAATTNPNNSTGKTDTTTPAVQRQESQSRAQQIASEHRQENETEGDETVKAEKNEVDGGLAGQMGGVSLGDNEGRASMDGIATQPGKPLGDVVFDHEPSEGELEEARKSLDQSR